MRKIILALAAIACLHSINVSAQVFQADWDIVSLSYEGTSFNKLKLDLDSLPRFFDATGVIESSNGSSFRPISGTCVVEGTTGNIVCTLRLDALSLEIRILESGDGSIELVDTITVQTLDVGAIILNSIQ